MTKAPKPTRESMAIAAAIQASGMTKAAIAKQLGVEPANVSFWATARRPVPAPLAAPLASLLGIAPSVISAAYAKVAAAGSVRETPATYGDETIRPDLEVARLQNDIHALNLALGALVVAMARHRPTEARDAASAMRKSIPRKYRDRGLIHELLATLDQA